MKPQEETYARYRLERAHEALNDAKVLLLNAGSLPSTVNRLYYACFYCVSALLLTQGLRAAKHSGVLALFDQHWVKAGHVPTETGRFYYHLFRHRLKGDYTDLAKFDRAEVERWHQQAVEFVAGVARLVEQGLADQAPKS